MFYEEQLENRRGCVMSEWRNKFGQTESECNKICKERYGIDVAAIRSEREKKDYGDLILNSAEQEKRDRERYGDEVVDVKNERLDGLYSTRDTGDDMAVANCKKLIAEGETVKSIIQSNSSELREICNKLSVQINKISDSETKTKMIEWFDRLLDFGEGE